MTTLLHTATGAACLLAAQLACAQGAPLGGTQRTWFELGAIAAEHRSSLRDDGIFSSSTGSDVQAEDDLGLDRRNAAFAIGFGRRIGQAWRFEADVLGSWRESDKVLTRAIEVGGFTYAAGTPLKTTLALRLWRFAGGVSVLQSDSAELGVLVGGAIAGMRLRLQDGSSRIDSNAADIMPLLGLYFSTALAPSWQLSGRVDAAARDGSSMVNASLHAVWRVTPNLGLAAGARFAKGHLRDDAGDLFVFSPTRADFRIGGPQLSLNLAF